MQKYFRESEVKKERYVFPPIKSKASMIFLRDFRRIPREAEGGGKGDKRGFSGLFILPPLTHLSAVAWSKYSSYANIHVSKSHARRGWRDREPRHPHPFLLGFFSLNGPHVPARHHDVTACNLLRPLMQPRGCDNFHRFVDRTENI